MSWPVLCSRQHGDREQLGCCFTHPGEKKGRPISLWGVGQGKAESILETEAKGLGLIVEWMRGQGWGRLHFCPRQLLDHGWCPWVRKDACISMVTRRRCVSSGIWIVIWTGWCELGRYIWPGTVFSWEGCLVVFPRWLGTLQTLGEEQITLRRVKHQEEFTCFQERDKARVCRSFPVFSSQNLIRRWGFWLGRECGWQCRWTCTWCNSLQLTMQFSKHVHHLGCSP